MTRSTDSFVTQLDQVIEKLQEEENQHENVEARPLAAKLIN